MNIITKLITYLNAPEFVGSITGYTRAKSEEVKLRVQDKISFIIAKIAILAAIGLVFLFLLLFLSLTASQYFNDSFDSMYAGYGIVTLFYLVLLIILFLIKNVESLNTYMRKTVSKLVNSLRDVK